MNAVNGGQQQTAAFSQWGCVSWEMVSQHWVTAHGKCWQKYKHLQPCRLLCQIKLGNSGTDFFKNSLWRRKSILATLWGSKNNAAASHFNSVDRKENLNKVCSVASVFSFPGTYMCMRNTDPLLIFWKEIVSFSLNWIHSVTVHSFSLKHPTDRHRTDISLGMLHHGITNRNWLAVDIYWADNLKCTQSRSYKEAGHHCYH